MKESITPQTHILTCVMAICSYTEYKTDIFNAHTSHFYYVVSGKEPIKEFRFVNKAYNAEIRLNTEQVTEHFISTCEKLANNASDVASEYIKLGRIDYAKYFLSTYLEMDLKAAGFTITSPPTIYIHTSIDRTDWFNVVINDQLINASIT